MTDDISKVVREMRSRAVNLPDIIGDAVMLRMSDFGRDELLSGEELDAAIDARLASDSEGGE